MVFTCTLGAGGNTAAIGGGVGMIAAGSDFGGISAGNICVWCSACGGVIGNGTGGDGDGMGYIVFKMLAICRTPWMVGSPILIPGGGAVE